MKLIRALWHGVLWLRQIIFVIYIALLTFILALITVILSLLCLPIRIRLIPAQIWSTLMRWGLVIFLWLRVRIEGEENLLKEPCIYICKHQSSWETVILHGLLHNICFVLKEELLNIPLFGQALKVVDSIPIDRKQNLKSFKKILQMGKERLHSGLSIVIFPEGTRVAIGNYPKFHKTAITLAKSTGAMVVPVAHNSGCFWPNKAGLIKPGLVTLSIGQAISSSELNIDELNNYCYQWINDKVKQIGG
ncbi:lysophospholipid acyltransferase family protein [Fastidiosibacter lacustris]|uniref:lysophospholipid acyltransferase family protein n=1 Tax=Fastidiosibacter lacustris TaxID=2056695 RepID=UPI000E3468C4|nr:lysophospholipid acyltransferase family protein [Fastidiosibacter lacustris]